MIVAVIDTETTGDGETDEVVEVGAVLLELNEAHEIKKTRLWTSLFRPSVPVQAVARAAHHITDKMLARAPVLKLKPLPIRADVVVAHNAEFDVRMLVQSGVPREDLPEKVICTWRCSLHLWPEAPKHSNQVLRYHLGVEPLARVPGLPHRALPDAVLTAGLLMQMLKTHTLAQLVDLTSGPVLLHKVRFGKYRGMKWEELEDGYLHWILSKSFGPDEKHTAQHWINERRKQCQEQSQS